MRVIIELIVPLVALAAIIFGAQWAISRSEKKGKDFQNRVGLLVLGLGGAAMLLGPFPMLAGLFQILLVWFLLAWVFGEYAFWGYIAIVGVLFGLDQILETDTTDILYKPALLVQESFHTLLLGVF